MLLLAAIVPLFLVAIIPMFVALNAISPQSEHRWSKIVLGSAVLAHLIHAGYAFFGHVMIQAIVALAAASAVFYFGRSLTPQERLNGRLAQLTAITAAAVFIARFNTPSFIAAGMFLLLAFFMPGIIARLREAVTMPLDLAPDLSVEQSPDTAHAPAASVAPEQSFRAPVAPAPDEPRVLRPPGATSAATPARPVFPQRVR